MGPITIYRARKIITMDPNRPVATHVACRDGLILAVGTLAEASIWGRGEVDERFAEHVILPGLVEAHAHVMAGGVADLAYLGHYPRTGPDGEDWPAVPDTEALIARLRAEAEASEGRVVGWGVDPNVLPGERLSKAHLDRVSADRPVVVYHSNFHLMTVNSATLAAVGYDAGTNVEGVVKGPDGAPNGELQEFEAMGRVMHALGIEHKQLCQTARALRNYGKLARTAGVTTAADLWSELSDGEVAMLTQVTGEPDFPARYHPVMDALAGPGEEMAERARALAARSTAKLRMGAAKLFTDGAIQGFTAQLKPPGYFRGRDCGIWNMPIPEFKASVRALNAAGVQIHIHTNGDAASELGLDAIEEALRHAPFPDHRHTLEHVQLADRAQFRRARALGVCVNLFANHIHYFGDVHYATTVGPDRAERMNAFRDALDIGVPIAVHSDAPITPLAPLFSAWIAVTRRTMGGRVLGARQCLTVAEALHAITLGAAYILRMDGEIGSVATGKRADFCVLDDDPLTRPPEELREIGIVGTVLDGRPTA